MRMQLINCVPLIGEHMVHQHKNIITLKNHIILKLIVLLITQDLNSKTEQLSVLFVFKIFYGNNG